MHSITIMQSFLTTPLALTLIGASEMNSTACSANVVKLPSTIIWSENDPLHVGIGIAGFVLAFLGSFNILRLDRTHIMKGTEGLTTYGLPDRVAWTVGLLRLGIVMMGMNAAILVYPEFKDLLEVFTGLYRGYAFYALWALISIQFGGVQNMANEEGTGTLQRHDEQLFWATKPFCCFQYLCCCCPCMTPQKMRVSHIKALYFGMIQFVVISPIASAVLIAAHYGQVHVDRRSTVTSVCSFFQNASLVMVIYSTKGMIAVAENSESLVQQAKDHKKAPELSVDNRPSTVPVDESYTAKNISPKDFWITFITAFPALTGIIVAILVNSDKTLANGDVLLKADRQAFWNAFATILINFLGSFLAWQNFPDTEEEANHVEYIAGAMLNAERAPAYVLRGYVAHCERIIAARQAQGIDINLGKTPTAMVADLLYDGDEECPVDLPAKQGVAPGLAPGSFQSSSADAASVEMKYM